MKRIQQTLKGWAHEAPSGTHPGRAIIKHIFPSWAQTQRGGLEKL